MKFKQTYLLVIYFSAFISLIKGDKLIGTINSKFPIISLNVNENSAKIFNNHNGKTKFLFQAERGDNIILNISYSNVNFKEDYNFSLFVKFKVGNSYFFNNENITIKNFENERIKLIEFKIPYEIYCNSPPVIFLNELNEIINFNLNSNIFPKNDKYQYKERIKIKIIDLFYSKRNSTSKFPVMNFDKSKYYDLNKTFNLRFSNDFQQNNSFIIKYKLINPLDNLQSTNECSVKIKKRDKRNLQATNSNDEYYYIFGEIFENEEAYDNVDDIVEFLNHDINVFNISEQFFQDLCLHYERNHHDYVLEDRIEFFYQNYSLCNNSNCNLTKIYFANFSYSCICLPVIETEETRHKKEHSMDLNEEFSMEGLSQEMSNLFFESNLSVIKCFFEVLADKVIMNNYGVLLIGALLLIQLFASLFLYSHMNDIRLYVFRDLIKCKYNPPPRRENNNAKNRNGIHIGDSRASTLKRINSKITRSPYSYNEIKSSNISHKNLVSVPKYGGELSSVQNMIPINSKYNNEVSNENDNIDIYNNDKNTINNNKKRYKKRINNYNANNIKLQNKNLSSQRKINNNNKIGHDNIYVYNKKEIENDINEKISEYFENKDNNSNRKENIQSEIMSSSHNENNLSGRSDGKNEKDKDLIYPYEKIDYDDDDLDELDFDEALIYDKRTFCQLFCKQLKERQIIANTFCVKDKLKPFSIKIILLIFNTACYLVINGFLFNEDYVMKILRRKTKNFYFFIVDSTTRIVYSSLIGVIINIIVGLLFRADKQLRKVQAKHQDNKIILHGEIVKIYKSTKLLYIIFTIFNVVAMLVFMYYLFCFCGVYRNCQDDWFEGCFIVIYIMQFLPVLICLLLAALRKAGLVCNVEFFFNINSWIIENL